MHKLFHIFSRLPRPRFLAALGLALPALLVPLGALAQLPNDPDFYRVTVPVQGTGATSRNKGQLEAIEVMLQRLTGQTDPTALSGWSSVRANPSRYTAGLKFLNRRLDELSLFDKLKTSEYINRRDALDGSESGVSGATQVTVLEVTFDKPSLEKLLENNAWTRWPATRPRVALWVFRRQGFREDLVPSAHKAGSLFSAPEVAKYSQTLKYLFSRPGISYTAPSPIWIERNSQMVSKVKSGQFSKAAQHYARQGYSEFVIVRVRADGSSHYAGFTRHKLSRQGGSARSVWESYGTTFEDVLADGTSSLFRRMAGDYVRDAGSLQDIDLHLEVSQVLSLEDYARVLIYLTRMPQNVDVQVLRVSDSSVEYMLKTRGVWSDILRVYSSATVFEVAQFKQPQDSLFDGGSGLEASADPQPGSDDGEDWERQADAGDGDPNAGDAVGDLLVRTQRAKHYLHAIMRH